MKLSKILKGFDKLYTQLEQHLMECEVISKELTDQRTEIHKAMDSNYKDKEATKKAMEKLEPLCSPLGEEA